MRRKILLWATAAAAVFALAACTSSSDDTTTTTAEPMSTTTTTVEETTTTTIADTTTTIQVNQLTPPEYEIVQRLPLEGGGDEVVVLLDPASYQSLTDLDIYDIIAEVVDEHPPVWIMHVVDSPTAANVVGNPESSNEDIASIEDNYLARLDNGTDVTYLGPFASSGGAVLGS